MCGSYGPYSGQVKEKSKKTWSTFWNQLELPEEDQGIFIEIVKGCADLSCKLQCQARGKIKETMPLDELCHILDVLKTISHPTIMLYGMGDVTHYDWVSVRKILGRFPANSRVNISPVIQDEQLLSLAEGRAEIYFNVDTPEKAILANLKSNVLGCRDAGAIVPVMKGVEWIEIFKILQMKIEFRSYTPDWSDKYIPPGKFQEGMMSLGVSVEPISYKLKSGFKPVIERLHDNVLTIRRCFQSDSGKLKLNISKDPPDWAKNDESVCEKLLWFASTKTSCGKCSKIVWRYNR